MSEFEPTTPVETISDSPNPFILITIVIGIAFSAFAGGFLVKDYLGTIPSTPTPTVSPLPTPSSDSPEQPGTNFVPGHPYLEDTFIVITKTPPITALVATVSRSSNQENLKQTSRASFFDGVSWRREVKVQPIKTMAILPDSLVRQWTITIDPSRVLKQFTHAKLTLADRALNVNFPVLENEIAIRSLPEYTKFISVADPVVSIDNNIQPFYGMYNRVYSANANFIQVYDNSLNLTTHWLSIWTKSGEYYHLDKTEVKNPNQVYQSHQIGVAKNADTSIVKTYEISVPINDEKQVRYELHNPINAVINCTKGPILNKAPDNSYRWEMTPVECLIDREGVNSSALGLSEFITR